MTHNKAAFTLAEVLITLGIIGVVAALTIPGLMTAYKAHRLRSQFLKSYSTVQQVFKQMEADDVSLDPNTYPPQTFYKTFFKYFVGGFNCGATLLNKGGVCYGKDIKTGKIENPYTTLNGKFVVPQNFFDDGQLALPDGALVLIENPMISNPTLWVSVDTNGYNNPPNRFGYDLFTFEFLDGELRTMGDLQTKYNNIDKYCNFEKDSDVYNGIACAKLAKENPDYFKFVLKNVHR